MCVEHSLHAPDILLQQMVRVHMPQTNRTHITLVDDTTDTYFVVRLQWKDFTYVRMRMRIHSYFFSISVRLFVSSSLDQEQLSRARFICVGRPFVLLLIVGWRLRLCRRCRRCRRRQLYNLFNFYLCYLSVMLSTQFYVCERARCNRMQTHVFTVHIKMIYVQWQAFR